MPGPCCIELDACCALAGGLAMPRSGPVMPPDPCPMTTLGPPGASAIPGASNPGGGALGPSTVPTGVEYCDAGGVA
eukprot:975051-Alexandrium_andersonii.AAC.1